LDGDGASVDPKVQTPEILQQHRNNFPEANNDMAPGVSDTTQPTVAPARRFLMASGNAF